jgi:hypothetical protein
MRLREHLDSMRVAGPDGRLLPLVRSERVLAEGGRWPVPARPRSMWWGYLVVGLLSGVLFALLAGTRAFLPLAWTWSLLVTVLGGLLAWFWIFSHHVATYRNENLFPLNLLALGLVVTLPAVAFGRTSALLAARRLAQLMVGLALLGLLLKALPWFRQHNLEVLFLALPVHAGVWLGLERRVRALEPS